MLWAGHSDLPVCGLQFGTLSNYPKHEDIYFLLLDALLAGMPARSQTVVCLRSSQAAPLCCELVTQCPQQFYMRSCAGEDGQAAAAAGPATAAGLRWRTRWFRRPRQRFWRSPRWPTCRFAFLSDNTAESLSASACCSASLKRRLRNIEEHVDTLK